MKTLSEVLDRIQTEIPAEVIHPPDSSAGIFGEYVTAQWAMQEANAIFDLDGMSFDVLSDRSIEIPIPGESFGNWVFITTVKITFSVLDDDGDDYIEFSRIGRGVGVAQAPTNRQTKESYPVKTQQMDTAAKTALSDAIKNALMRTGQRLGAQLYFDERVAQVLGYEIESDRASRGTSSRSDGGDDTADELGDVVCKYGFGEAGEDGKKNFQGWTIQEMWDDAEGRKIFQWAVDKEATGWFNERLRKFAALMEEESGEPPVRIITIWTGEEKPADEHPNWSKLCTNEGFLNLLKEAFDPEGKIKNFNPNHKRMVNHYRYHFGVNGGVDLTWEMLNALVLRCKDGEEAVAFGYPQWYGDKDDETEEPEAEEESQEEAQVTPESVHDTPPFVIGPARNQKVPTGLQVAAKDAGVEDPKSWLWETLLGEKPVGEWTEAHTDLTLKIISTIKDGTIEYDSTVVGQMWAFGTGQIG